MKRFVGEIRDYYWYVRDVTVVPGEGRRELVKQVSQMETYLEYLKEKFHLNDLIT
jgi:hypothetical protein